MSKLMNDIYEERFRPYKSKLTPEKFKRWMHDHSLTYMQAGRLLGFQVSADRYECTTVNRIANGTWTGWTKLMEVIALEAKMKIVEKILLTPFE